MELREDSKKPAIIEELGQGDTIGLNEALLQTVNKRNYITVRFTSVIYLPISLIFSLNNLLPFSNTLTPLYAQCARRMSQQRTKVESHHNFGILSNVRTIAIVFGSSNISSVKFANYLHSCLEKYSQ